MSSIIQRIVVFNLILLVLLLALVGILYVLSIVSKSDAELVAERFGLIVLIEAIAAAVVSVLTAPRQK